MVLYITLCIIIRNNIFIIISGDSKGPHTKERALEEKKFIRNNVESSVILHCVHLAVECFIINLHRTKIHQQQAQEDLYKGCYLQGGNGTGTGTGTERVMRWLEKN